MNRATKNNTIITGKELNKEIISHYAAIHQGRSSNVVTKFPKINVSKRHIMEACCNVKFDKALTFDGIDPQLFNLENRKETREIKDKKLEILKLLTTEKYWD